MLIKSSRIWARTTGGQYHEVQYEKNKMNVSGEAVKQAIMTEASSHKKVEKKLKG